MLLSSVQKTTKTTLQGGFTAPGMTWPPSGVSSKTRCKETLGNPHLGVCFFVFKARKSASHRRRKSTPPINSILSLKKLSPTPQNTPQLKQQQETRKNCPKKSNIFGPNSSWKTSFFVTLSHIRLASMMKWDQLPGSFFFANQNFSGASSMPPLGCLPTQVFFHPICFFWGGSPKPWISWIFFWRLLSPQDLHSTGGMFGQTHQGPFRWYGRF